MEYPFLQHICIKMAGLINLKSLALSPNLLLQFFFNHFDEVFYNREMVEIHIMKIVLILSLTYNFTKTNRLS